MADKEKQDEFNCKHLKCNMCGTHIDKYHYYPAFHLELQKELIFCSRECYKRYIDLEKEI